MAVTGCTVCNRYDCDWVCSVDLVWLTECEVWNWYDCDWVCSVELV